jgi:hypothetical protein
MRERVKLALRHGVVVNQVPGAGEAEDGEAVRQVVMFADDEYDSLFVQDAKRGQVRSCRLDFIWIYR